MVQQKVVMRWGDNIDCLRILRNVMGTDTCKMMMQHDLGLIYEMHESDTVLLQKHIFSTCSFVILYAFAVYH